MAGRVEHKTQVLQGAKSPSTTGLGAPALPWAGARANCVQCAQLGLKEEGAPIWLCPSLAAPEKNGRGLVSGGGALRWRPWEAFSSWPAACSPPCGKIRPCLFLWLEQQVEV